MIKPLLLRLARQMLDLAWAADLLDGSAYLRARYPHLAPALIVEVGARFGEDTALLAASYPEARVLTFECNPPALAIAFPRLASLSNVLLRSHALGNAAGTLPFSSIEVEGNAGASSLLMFEPGAERVAGVDPGLVRRIEVRVERLDSVLNDLNLPPPDLIWMDVEGAEMLVLEGAGELLANTSVVYTEVALHNLRKGQSNWREIRNHLGRYGLIERRPWLRWLRQALRSPTMNIVFERPHS